MRSLEFLGRLPYILIMTTSTTLTNGIYLGCLVDGSIISINRIESTGMLTRLPGARVDGAEAPASPYGANDRGFQIDGEPMMVRFSVENGAVVRISAA